MEFFFVMWRVVAMYCPTLLFSQGDAVVVVTKLNVLNNSISGSTKQVTILLVKVVFIMSHILKRTYHVLQIVGAVNFK